MKVVITGASGVLGSAIYEELRKDTSLQVKGLSHSSSRDDLTRIDLLDPHATEELIAAIKPDWVIHCAAERRPDIASQRPEATQKLNADVPGTLADLSTKYNFVLVYISTDYVFDGRSPPYEVDAETNPLNFYGKSKREGEIAVLRTRSDAQASGQRIVLRVPVLYGPAPKNSDTAVNILVDIVQDGSSGQTYKMDHVQTRFPTNTQDIASFLHRLILRPTSTNKLPPIIHYTAKEPLTKYEMCLILAKVLDVPHDHIVPDTEEPKGDAAVTRPKNCMLSTKVIEEELGMDVGAGLFEQWWTGYLKDRR